MSRKVLLLPLAHQDQVRLEAFLERKSPKAALRAALAISNVVLSLAENAERGLLISKRGVRELPVRFGRDGYVIQYAVGDTAVLVIRIFHARENR